MSGTWGTNASEAACNKLLLFPCTWSQRGRPQQHRFGTSKHCRWPQSQQIVWLLQLFDLSTSSCQAMSRWPKKQRKSCVEAARDLLAQALWKNSSCKRCQAVDHPDHKVTKWTKSNCTETPTLSFEVSFCPRILEIDSKREAREKKLQKCSTLFTLTADVWCAGR